MFISQAHQPPTDPLRVLGHPQNVDVPISYGDQVGLVSPWRMMNRNRVLTVGALLDVLDNYRYTKQAFDLMQKFFPERHALYTCVYNVSWWAVMAEVVNLAIEADWFEADWGQMNLSWISWINSPTKDKGRHMAAFLEYIPVKLYGFSAQSIIENKPMNLLQLLLYDKAEAYHKDLPLEAEFPGTPENWGEKDREKAWTVLHRIEDDPGMYPMPVRCLPELGRWVCKRTRNIILDYHFDPRLNGPRFRWDSPDLEQLKLAWRRAKPIVQQQKKLTEWYERDPSRLILLTRFLTGADSYEQLDW